jgi:dihydropteroate synthase
MPRLIAVPPRPNFAGLSLDRPRIMGVLNVTPDSFSDGGKYLAPEAALARAQDMLAAGAEIIDVGGESTRPGAQAVSIDEEQRRVIRVIRALAERGVCVSVDTRHTAVMAKAIAAGARIVNDVSALADEGALALIAASDVAVILMHMQGTPGTMQQNPTYAWAPGDIFDFLKARVAACAAAGIGLERIAVDPGIGFGKTDEHNAAIFSHLALFHGLGCALAVGASRKAFIGRMSKGEGPEARLAGSLAAAVMVAERGAHLLRVHDVAETAQALAVWAKLSTVSGSNA